MLPGNGFLGLFRQFTPVDRKVKLESGALHVPKVFFNAPRGCGPGKGRGSGIPVAACVGQAVPALCLGMVFWTFFSQFRSVACKVKLESSVLHVPGVFFNAMPGPRQHLRGVINLGRCVLPFELR